ncbi:TRAP transporter solute receptor, TAXI family [Desulfarculus baarsii DSM 2075]|uniref:TRAP transporter solute receptor, TAXI family n=1 Tax=Desulfarculus baarsii (strain ATCC 33931 / DSM 2075 / LMG 7858 / VKM B-1802 / 2st14) TaxID=644282 RepID=E1QK89_DESB2|nr:TAXI family TRAP transporter solute-binding subunit [Desulfarculus baarsii]ADK85982.1 TRAP transporter solute receptor, TAXI family [Desulfarculus baarsii DSM 2075]
MPRQTALKACLSLMAVALLCLAGAARAQDDPRVLIFATGPTVTKDFAIGRNMATLWSLNMAQENNLQCKAVTTMGSEDNLSMLKLRKADLAVLERLVATTARDGVALYAGAPFGQLRAICKLWPNVENFVGLRGAATGGNILDIKGRIVSAGSPGNGEYSTMAILGALGVHRDDLQLRFLDPFESYKALVAGQIEAASIADGPASYCVQQVLANKDLNPVYLQFSAEQVAAVNANSPYKGWRMEIAPNTYPGQTEALFTLAQDNYLVCRADLDAEVVYLLAKVFFEKYSQWGSGLGVPPEVLTDAKLAVADLALPLHEGAYKFFKEQGVSVPAQAMPPELAPDQPAAAPQAKAQDDPSGE